MYVSIVIMQIIINYARDRGDRGGRDRGYNRGYGRGGGGGYGRDRGGYDRNRSGYGRDRDGYGRDRGGYGRDREDRDDNGQFQYMLLLPWQPSKQHVQL